MRIGIIARGGKLGYSIRTKAFLNTLKKSKDFEVVHVNLGDLSTGETFRAIAGHLGHVFNFSPLEIKKREIKADYVSKKLDEIVEKEKGERFQRCM